LRCAGGTITSRAGIYDTGSEGQDSLSHSEPGSGLAKSPALTFLPKSGNITMY